MSTKKLVYSLGLLGMVTGANNFIASLLLPKIAQEFSLSIVVASGILTYYMLAYGFMQLFYGVTCRYFGKVKMLRFLAVGFFLANIGCLWANSFIAVLIMRFLAGFFAAGNISLSLSIIGDNCKVEEQGKYIGKFMIFIFMGQSLTNFIGGFFLEYLDWRMIFGVLGVVVAIGLYYLYKLPNDLKDGDFANNNLRVQVKAALCSSYSLPVYILAFSMGALAFSFYGFLGSYFSEVMHLKSTISGSIMMIYGLASIIGSYLLQHLTRRFTMFDLMTGSSLIFALCLSTMLYLPQLAVVILAMIVLGIAFMLMQTSINSLAFKVSPEYKGLPNSIVGTLLFGGSAVGTAIGATVLERSSFNVLFLIYALGIVLLGLAAYLFQIQIKKKEVSKEKRSDLFA